MTPAPLTTRFTEAFNALISRVAALENRMTVSETRGESWERRLMELQRDLNHLAEEIRESQSQLRTSIDSMRGMFQKHVEQEDADRQRLFNFINEQHGERSKLMLGVMTTLGTLLLSVILFLAERVWTHMSTGVLP